MKVVAPSGAGRGVWGCVIALQTPLQFRYPRRGACARKSPNLVAELCVAPRRGGGAAFSRALLLPTMALPRSLWRRWFVLCVSQRLPLCVPPPRPIGSSLLVLKLPLLVPSGAGRGLKVCSSCRRCVLRASNGFPARSGATRAAKPPKTERGAFPTKRACRESAALGLPPCGGRRPLHWDIAPAGRGGAVAPRLWWRGARRGRGGILECDL